MTLVTGRVDSYIDQQRSSGPLLMNVVRRCSYSWEVKTCATFASFIRQNDRKPVLRISTSFCIQPASMTIRLTLSEIIDLAVPSGGPSFHRGLQTPARSLLALSCEQRLTANNPSNSRRSWMHSRNSTE